MITAESILIHCAKFERINPIKVIVGKNPKASRLRQVVSYIAEKSGVPREDVARLLERPPREIIELSKAAKSKIENSSDFANYVFNAALLCGMRFSIRPNKNAKKTPSLGFRWTEKDEIRINRAKVQAIEFMLHYGKGEQPYSCLIRSPYFHGITEEEND
jgi:hypothetical protein